MCNHHIHVDRLYMVFILMGAILLIWVISFKRYPYLADLFQQYNK